MPKEKMGIFSFRKKLLFLEREFVKGKVNETRNKNTQWLDYGTNQCIGITCCTNWQMFDTRVKVQRTQVQNISNMCQDNILDLSVMNECQKTICCWIW